jgi:hypothetical protein
MTDSAGGEPTSDLALEPELGWFHRYPARFSLGVLAEMFSGAEEFLGRKPKLVGDPFAGTGSTVAYARQLGIPSVGIELSTLGVLIAKTRLMPPRDLTLAVTIAEEMANAKYAIGEHLFTRELVDWIGESNCSHLARYLAKIRRLSDPKLRRWLTVSLSSSLRPCSRWLPGSIKPQIDPTRMPSRIGRHFLRASRALARDCKLESDNSSARTSARIELGDAKKLPFDDRSVDAVITSPPYETMYDYFDVHRLSYLAFGWPRPTHLQIGQGSGISRDGIGFEPPRFMVNWYRRALRAEESSQGRALRAYIVAMRAHVAEVKRVLSRKGVAAYAVANTVRNGRRFALAQMLASLFEEVGFSSVEMRPRTSSHRRILPAGRDRTTGQFSSNTPEHLVDEFVIYARK